MSTIFHTPDELSTLIDDYFHDYAHSDRAKIKAFFTACLTDGYNGKLVYVEKFSTYDRTTLSNFLSHYDWDDERMDQIRRQLVWDTIYEHSQETGEYISVAIDDTSNQKTRPSSHAVHPIEGAYDHFSHLEGKNVYGMQVFAAMLICGDLELIYDVQYYDQINKPKSKIDMAMDVISSLPEVSYGRVYFDSWYTSEKLLNLALSRGWYCIAALKRNRVLYVDGKSIQLQDYFAQLIGDPFATSDFVTVRGKDYIALRYEGPLNGVENAVVIMTMPVDANYNMKCLRAFVSMDTTLTTQEILDGYCERWPIEVFFRCFKMHLQFNKVQIRSLRGIKRFWGILAFVHLVCCIGTGEKLPFHEGRKIWNRRIQTNIVANIHQAGANGVSLEEVLSLIA